MEGVEQGDGLDPERVQGVEGVEEEDHREVGLANLLIGGSDPARGAGQPRFGGKSR